jgi:hypothetical protein
VDGASFSLYSSKSQSNADLFELLIDIKFARLVVIETDLVLGGFASQSNLIIARVPKVSPSPSFTQKPRRTMELNGAQAVFKREAGYINVFRARFLAPKVVVQTKISVGIVMVSSLRHHVSKDVLVSIPAIFGKKEAFRCQLIGFDFAGLWLKSVKLAQATLGDGAREPAPTFVPYAQISYLIAAPVQPLVEPPPAKPPPAVVPEVPLRRQGGARKPHG